MILSFNVLTYAAEEEEPASEPVICESSDAVYVYDPPGNRYNVSAYTVAYGSTVAANTTLNEVRAYNNDTTTLNIISGWSKTLGAHYVATFSYGSDDCGDLNNSITGNTGSYTASKSTYASPATAVTSSHQFSCNGAGWLTYTYY